MDMAHDGLFLACEGVCADEQAPEDRLVHQSPCLRVCSEVGRVGALDDRQRLIESFLGLLRFEVG
jgi:hypothetical protein